MLVIRKQLHACSPLSLGNAEYASRTRSSDWSSGRQSARPIRTLPATLPSLPPAVAVTRRSSLAKRSRDRDCAAAWARFMVFAQSPLLHYIHWLLPSTPAGRLPLVTEYVHQGACCATVLLRWRAKEKAVLAKAGTVTVGCLSLCRWLNEDNGSRPSQGTNTLW